MDRAIVRRPMIYGNTTSRVDVSEATDLIRSRSSLIELKRHERCSSARSRLKYLSGLVGRPMPVVSERLNAMSRDERGELDRALTYLLRDDMSDARGRADNVKTVYLIFYQLK